MDILSSSTKRTNESNLELFRARLQGKLCIALICAVSIIPRIFIVIGPPVLPGLAEWLQLFTIPILLLMISMILIEYFLFRKNGLRFAKYANLVDISVVLLFMAEWTMVLISAFLKVKGPPPALGITAVFGFSAFSWRTLLMTLIVQSWKLKMIPSVAASLLCGIYVTYFIPHAVVVNLARTALQIFSIVTILFCEGKIKWRMIWRNLQQEEWMQVNNFILNNIPENIMILNFAGKAKFVSDYCKSFLKECQLSVENTDDLFDKIKDLEQQQGQSEPELDKSIASEARIQIERFTTQNELLAEANEGPSKIEVLRDLVANFKKIIEEKNLQERQFLAYNGKLKMDHNEKSIEIKISFIHHFNNEYIILILRDMTQRDLLVTLEETNKYKDQLLASVSHELRAPLNGNINLIEGALNSSKDSDGLKESFLIPALRSGRFLLHIINDILDMSQIKEKKLRLVFEDKNLKETLRGAAQLIELQAEKKEIELNVELDQSLPENFSTDHMRLSQIVLNLLSNAIKFTKDGFIKLTAVCVEMNNDWIQICVEDSGIGIQKDNFQRLFSSYANIDIKESPALNPAGVGLGLNIASNLVKLLAPESHPGIHVTSVLKEGSKFSFIIENKQLLACEKLQKEQLEESVSREIADELPQIPLPRIQRNDTGSDGSLSAFLPLGNRASELEALAEEKCCCPKILIVDDNPFNIMAFETILNSLDIKCDSVYSGSACIQRLLGRQAKKCGRNCMPYSVVFMDQEMPEMTGSETVVEIKRLQRENLVPEMKIIGCTAHKIKEEVDKFLESGLDSCIFKPISVGMIKDILKEILSD